MSRALFEQWLDDCPVQWLRLSYQPDSTTYEFIFDEDNDDDNESL